MILALTAAALSWPVSTTCAKSVFNLRIDDVGNGWTRLTTETRVYGLDPPGRRALARYWRLIYPGTGIIRRVWLDAIRARAERDKRPTHA